jgi:hypothetical protein
VALAGCCKCEWRGAAGDVPGAPCSTVRPSPTVVLPPPCPSHSLGIPPSSSAVLVVCLVVCSRSAVALSTTARGCSAWSLGALRCGFVLAVGCVVTWRVAGWW